jgi:hypothetical protein
MPTLNSAETLAETLASLITTSRTEGLLKKPNPLKRSCSQSSIAGKLTKNMAIDSCYNS